MIMSKKDTLLISGYSIEEIPNLDRQPFAWYRHKDGRIVWLPADAYSLRHYLGKGLVLVPIKTNEQAPPEIGT